MRNILTCPFGTLSVPLGHSALMAEFGDQALAASISAISSTANAIYNNYATDVADDKAFERTKELQDRDRRWQRDFYNYRFDKEMEYNTPKAQMDRYKAAGLNPYLLSRDNGMIGSGNSAPEPVASSSQVFPHRQVIPADFASAVAPMSQLLAMGSSIKRNNADAFQKIVSSLPELGRTLGWSNVRSYAKNLLGMSGIQDSQYERQMEAVISGMEINNSMSEIQRNLASVYGEKDAQNRIALQEQAFSESAARIGLMSSEVKVNDSQVKVNNQKIHVMAAEYCEKVAHAYNLRKQGDVYAVNAYVLDQIKDMNVSLKRLELYRAQRQNSTEGALFESMRSVRDYQQSDPEAQSVNLENYINNNDTFWNEVNVIMSSWQVKTNIGLSGSYGF